MQDFAAQTWSNARLAFDRNCPHIILLEEHRVVCVAAVFHSFAGAANPVAASGVIQCNAGGVHLVVNCGVACTAYNA
jgi:hypothetical protein